MLVFVPLVTELASANVFGYLMMTMPEPPIPPVPLLAAELPPPPPPELAPPFPPL